MAGPFDDLIPAQGAQTPAQPQPVYGDGAPVTGMPVTGPQASYSSVAGAPSGQVGTASNPYYDYDGGQAPDGSAHVTQQGNLVDPQGITMNSGASPFDDLIPPAKSDEMLGFSQEFLRPGRNVLDWISKVPVAGQGLDALSRLVNNGEGLSDAIKGYDSVIPAAAAQGRTPGAAGSWLGALAGTSPLMMSGPGVLPAVLGGAASGALLTKNPDNPGSVGLDTGVGALSALGGYGALKGLGALIAPKLSPAVQTLKDAGVTLTPGQLIGGAAHRVEDSLTSTPFLGDAIRNAQRQSLQTFNAAAFNRALAPIGEQLPANTSGRAAVAYTQDKLGQAYDDLAPQLTAVADAPLAQDVINARGELGSGPSKWSDEFDRILTNEVAPRFNSSGVLSGQAAKDVDTVLGLAQSKYAPNPDPGAQGLVRGLGALNDGIQASLERNSGQDAVDRLNAINEGYANFVRPQIAASSPGAKNGLFTAPQLSGAVRSATDSVRKLAYGRGDALMQDLADAGTSVLPSDVPDSGTALRYAMSELPILAGVTSESHVMNLGALGKILGLAGVAGSAYTKPGMWLLNKAVDSRPDLGPLRKIIDDNATTGGVLSGLLGSTTAQNLLPAS